MSDILIKLPKDLQLIVDYYLHNLRMREIVLSIKYMSYCYNCDVDFVDNDIFTNKFKNELGIIKWKFEIPYVCNYNYNN